MLPFLDEDAVESLGGWMWQTDDEHRFTYMSRNVERIIGRAAEWHYNKTRQELGNICVVDRSVEIWLRQLGQRAPFGPTDFVRSQNGGSVMLRAIGYPIFDGLGRFRGYRGIGFRLPTSEPETYQGRSRPPRMEVGQPAELILPNDDVRVICQIRNVSESGAGIELPHVVPVPDRIVLKVADALFYCSVQWRQPRALGVRFVEPEDGDVRLLP
jgi:hypothetical protein